MEADLLAALQERYGDNPTGVEQHHFNFARTNRSRAQAICNRIKARTDFVFRGRRVLDVGCAYAGFVVLCARLGASAWGVEVDEKFFEYGQLNARDEPGDIHLIHGDILSPRTIERLPQEFDLVLVNDVFEHIYDTCRLLAHLARVTVQGGRVVFTIPNGEALEFLFREGHNLQLGLTLLPPNLWHYVVKCFGAYYRPWPYYAGLFGAYGFDRLSLWNAKPERSYAEMVDRLRADLADVPRLIQESTYSDTIKRAMQSSLADLRRRAEADIARRDPELLHWKYFVKFWEGCALKTGRPTDAAAHFT